MKSFPALLFGVGTLCYAFASGGNLQDLSGRTLDPFSSHARVRVFLFVRTDCPITNRYAPELRRISDEFKDRPVDFWLVYTDRSEASKEIRNSIEEYRLPGVPLRDSSHVLATRAHATTAPEAAVFDQAGELLYHGRIDDRYVDIGKARPAAEVHDLEDAISAVLSGKPVRQAETRAVGCSLADVE